MKKNTLTFLLAFLANPAWAEQAPALLFPQAFVVEHQLIDRQADGTTFYGEPVRDTYGGSWIVSERGDGSRLIVDLARREMTEIRPQEGVYWTVGFARFAELRRQVARHQAGGAPPGAVQLKAAAGEPAPPPELELVELTRLQSRRAAGAASQGGREVLSELAEGPDIRRFAVQVAGSAEPGAEVWVQSRLRLGEAAQSALQVFEEDALGAERPGVFDPARVMAVVRRQTGGALPVFTSLPVLHASGEKLGESEDRVFSATPLAAFSAELTRVPEGLVRISHPLESILVSLEEQARIDAALAGKSTP